MSEYYDCTKNIGSIRHAFILTYYFLLRAQNRNNNFEGFFEYVLTQVIKLGGDTDTNAAIVMAMIGALVGVQDIPQELLGKVLSFDCTTEGIIRPSFLSVRENILNNIEALIALRPLEQLNIVEE